MSKRFALIVVATAGLLLSTRATGRFVEDWPYERLMKESDLVVFATAVKTEATDEKFTHSLWPHELVGQNTTFDIRFALKGEPPKGKLTVLHFKFGGLKAGVSADEGWFIINGPSLVVFRPAYVSMVKNAKWTPEYLLFLRKLKDGRYEPVSGRIDPAFAVREVFERGVPREIDWRRTADEDRASLGPADPQPDAEKQQERERRPGGK